MTVPKARTVKRGKNKDRWYPIGDDGTAVPGVSSCKDVMAKPALPPAAAKETAAFVVRNRDTIQMMTRQDAFEWIKGSYRRAWGLKSSLGTEVHDACEQVARAVMAMNAEPDPEKKKALKPRFEVRDEVLPFVKNYARFLAEFDVEPVMLETTVVNTTVGYAGTLDALGRLTIPDWGRVLVVFDTKTGASGVWDESALQQSAYNHAEYYIDNDTGELVPMPKIEQDAAYALWLRPEGFALIPLDTGPSTFRAFTMLRDIYVWSIETEENGGLVGKAINANPIKRGWNPPNLGE